jgi:hypothetical protein
MRTPQGELRGLATGVEASHSRGRQIAGVAALVGVVVAAGGVFAGTRLHGEPEAGGIALPVATHHHDSASHAADAHGHKDNHVPKHESTPAPHIVTATARPGVTPKITPSATPKPRHHKSTKTTSTTEQAGGGGATYSPSPSPAESARQAGGASPSIKPTATPGKKMSAAGGVIAPEK